MLLLSPPSLWCPEPYADQLSPQSVVRPTGNSSPSFGLGEKSKPVACVGGSAPLGNVDSRLISRSSPLFHRSVENTSVGRTADFPSRTANFLQAHMPGTAFACSLLPILKLAPGAGFRPWQTLIQAIQAKLTTQAGLGGPTSVLSPISSYEQMAGLTGRLSKRDDVWPSSCQPEGINSPIRKSTRVPSSDRRA